MNPSPRAKPPPFIPVALTFLLAGTTLGLLMTRQFTVPRLRLHGQFQVYGFCLIFTMGVAYQMLGELLKARRQPLKVWASLLCTAGGTLGLGLGLSPPTAWAAMQKLGFLMFLLAHSSARPPQPHVYARKGKAQPFFMATGLLWLLLATTPEQALWSFFPLYVLGVGFRIHPGLFRRKAPPEAVQWGVLGLWNAGLVSGQDWLFLLGAGLAVASLRPFPKDLTTMYIASSYAWLLFAVSLRLVHHAGARHAMGSGFLLLMIVGMAYRLLPAFQGRTRQSVLPAFCLSLLLSGLTLRLFGPFGLGISLQAAGILLFIMSQYDIDQLRRPR